MNKMTPEITFKNKRPSIGPDYIQAYCGQNLVAVIKRSLSKSNVTEVSYTLPGLKTEFANDPDYAKLLTVKTVTDWMQLLAFTPAEEK